MAEAAGSSAGGGQRSSAGSITIKVKTLAPATYELDVSPEAAVLEVKQLLVGIAGMPLDRQRLIFHGRVLQDSVKLSESNVEDGHTLHLVERNPAAAAQAQVQQAGAGQARQPGSGLPGEGGAHIGFAHIDLEDGDMAGFGQMLSTILQSALGAGTIGQIGQILQISTSLGSGGPGEAAGAAAEAHGTGQEAGLEGNLALPAVAGIALGDFLERSEGLLEDSTVPLIAELRELLLALSTPDFIVNGEPALPYFRDQTRYLANHLWRMGALLLELSRATATVQLALEGNIAPLSSATSMYVHPDGQGPAIPGLQPGMEPQDILAAVLGGLGITNAGGIMMGGDGDRTAVHMTVHTEQWPPQPHAGAAAHAGHAHAPRDGAHQHGRRGGAGAQVPEGPLPSPDAPIMLTLPGPAGTAMQGQVQDQADDLPGLEPVPDISSILAAAIPLAQGPLADLTQGTAPPPPALSTGGCWQQYTCSLWARARGAPPDLGALMGQLLGGASQAGSQRQAAGRGTQPTPPDLGALMGQLLGGGSSGGGGGGGPNLGGLMSQMMPLVQQMLGAGSSSEARSRAAPSAEIIEDLDDEDSPLHELPDEEAANWRAVIGADRERQSHMPLPARPLSQVYQAGSLDRPISNAASQAASHDGDGDAFHDADNE
ncbi:hypothetical protein WJX72_006923 [[Myrmecia] bisecta]|uniref:Ubiquitin-like domain-containing protein n=1 Tax=[Myrmecia] bisecta TaxID=41462 RepID=A0AAW1QR31_9CHLO